MVHAHAVHLRLGALRSPVHHVWRRRASQPFPCRTCRTGERPEDAHSEDCVDRMITHQMKLRYKETCDPTERFGYTYPALRNDRHVPGLV